MKCKEAQRLLSEYIDGALDVKTASALEAHLAECGKCRGLHRELAGTVKLLKELPVIKAPEDFPERVSLRLQRKLLYGEEAEKAGPVRKRIIPLVFSRSLATVAAVLMLMLLVHIYYKMMGPEGAAPATKSLFVTEKVSSERRVYETPERTAALAGRAGKDEALTAGKHKIRVIEKAEEEKGGASSWYALNGLEKSKTQTAESGTLRPEGSGGVKGAPEKEALEKVAGEPAEKAPRRSVVKAGAGALAADESTAALRSAPVPSGRKVTGLVDADINKLKPSVSSNAADLKFDKMKKMRDLHIEQRRKEILKRKRDREKTAAVIEEGFLTYERKEKETRKRQLVIFKDERIKIEELVPETIFLGEEVNIYSAKADEDYRKTLGILKEMKIEPVSSKRAKGAEARGVIADKIRYEFEEGKRISGPVEAKKIELELSRKQYFSLIKKLIEVKSISRIEAVKKAAQAAQEKKVLAKAKPESESAMKRPEKAEAAKIALTKKISAKAPERFKVIFRICTKSKPETKEKNN